MKVTRPLRRSLTARLFVAYGAASAIVVATLGLAVYVFTWQYLERQQESDLAALAEFYAAYALTSSPRESDLLALAPQLVEFFAPQAGYDIRVFGARTGALIAASRDIGKLPSGAALAELGNRRTTLFLPASREQPGRLYAARKVQAEAGPVLGVVELSRDVSQMHGYLRALRLILISASGFALLIALAVSLLVARHASRPLQQMVQATRSIARGDLSRRLPVTSEDEVGELAESINEMTAELGQLEAARRDFIARITHDLRTPLTGIKGLVINLQERVPAPFRSDLTTVDQQTDRLIRLVDDLLTVSRSQRGKLRIDRAEVDLRTVASESVSLASAQAERLGVRLSLEVPEAPARVRGDADRLQQAALNLIDNGIKATTAGGSVLVKVKRGSECASLEVRDNGRGLTDVEATQAFEPYYRGFGGGAGLGLTIAREIVGAHGGKIWLCPAAERGAVAGFSLPAAADGRSEATPDQI
jgi:signal transduction histidine kinase